MKKLEVVLAAALLATGVVAVRQWFELRDLNGLYAALEARTAAEAIRMAASTASTRATATRIEPDPVQASVPAAKDAGATAEDKLIMQLGRQALTTQRAWFREQRQNDVEKLHLTPAEENEFYELMVKHDIDAQYRRTTGGPAYLDDPEIKRRNAGEIAALLGSRYAQWQEIGATSIVSYEIHALWDARRKGDNAALPEAQEKSLTAALVAEQLSIDRDSLASTAGNSPQERQQQRQRNDSRMINVASAYLNPQQLAQYRKLRETRTTVATQNDQRLSK